MLILLLLFQSVFLLIDCPISSCHPHKGHEHGPYGRCDAPKAYEDFITSVQKKKKFSYLEVSCFICSKPIGGQQETPQNNSWSKSQTALIPLYNNILEFAILRKSLLTAVWATLFFNENCYVEIRTITAKTKFYSYIGTCAPKCRSVKNWNITALTDITVLSFTARIYPNATISVRRSTSYRKLSTAYDEGNQFLISVPCSLNRSVVAAQISFFRDSKHNPEVLDTDGQPVVVPCSPGGYATDPRTGKIATDNDYIKKAFGDSKRLKRAVEQFYPCLDAVYPSEPNSFDRPDKRPIYMDENGVAKGLKVMLPKPQKNGSPTDIENNEHENIIEEQKEDEQPPLENIFDTTENSTFYDYATVEYYEYEDYEDTPLPFKIKNSFLTNRSAGRSLNLQGRKAKFPNTFDNMSDDINSTLDTRTPDDENNIIALNKNENSAEISGVQSGISRDDIKAVESADRNYVSNDLSISKITTNALKSITNKYLEDQIQSQDSWPFTAEPNIGFENTKENVHTSKGKTEFPEVVTAKSNLPFDSTDLLGDTISDIEGQKKKRTKENTFFTRHSEESQTKITKYGGTEGSERNSTNAKTQPIWRTSNVINESPSWQSSTFQNTASNNEGTKWKRPISTESTMDDIKRTEKRSTSFFTTTSHRKRATTFVPFTTYSRDSEQRTRFFTFTSRPHRNRTKAIGSTTSSYQYTKKNGTNSTGFTKGTGSVTKGVGTTECNKRTKTTEWNKRTGTTEWNKITRTTEWNRKTRPTECDKISKTTEWNKRTRTTGWNKRTRTLGISWPKETYPWKTTDKSALRTTTECLSINMPKKCHKGCKCKHRHKKKPSNVFFNFFVDKDKDELIII